MCLIISEVLDSFTACHDNAPLPVEVMPHTALGLWHLTDLAPRVCCQAVAPTGGLGRGSIAATTDCWNAICYQTTSELCIVLRCIFCAKSYSKGHQLQIERSRGRVQGFEGWAEHQLPLC